MSNLSEQEQVRTPEVVEEERPVLEGEKSSIKEAVVRAPTTIEIDRKTSGLVARDNTELVRIIRIMMKGMAFPKTLDTEEKIIAAWNVAASLKLPPAIAIQNMAVIHGSVCIWGQLPKALAEASGELEDFSLVLIDKDQASILLENKNLNAEPWGAVCRIKRKGRTTNEYVFTMNDAEKAGLDKKSGPWKDYRKIMLSRRAVANAVKFEFPDALMGLNVAEYDLNEVPDLRDVTDGTERTKTFNETLKNLGNKSTTEGVKEN